MIRIVPLLALLAGCSLVPEYQRPAAPVPAQWPMQGPGAVPPAPTFNGDWRTYFADPPLQRLIEVALEHNRDLRIASARVEEARALAGLARADRVPSVDVGLQQQAAKLPGDLNTSGQPAISRRYDANLGFAAFELDFWGRLASLETSARAGFFASEFARRAFRLTLIGDVAATYYSLVELAARHALAEAVATSRAESRRLVEARRAVGLAGDLDFLAADASYQGALAEVASLARQKAAAENALRLLVGSDPGAVSSEQPVAALPAIAVGLPSAVLLNRPDVLAAEQKLIAAHANIGAARAAFLPKIVLTAAAGTASRALSGLFAAGSGAWNFVPVLKWPLFDAGRSEANLDLAEARRHVAVAEYERTLQQAFREVADLLAARTQYAAQLVALERAEAAQTERLARVEARQRSGLASYLELLDAQREHFAARQATLVARRALAATGAGLFKALGG